MTCIPLDPMALRTRRMILRTRNKQRIGYSGQRIENPTGLSAIRYPLSANKRYTLNAKKGLTLIEVLLAVSILAMGITGVLRGYASSIATLEVAQYNIDAVNLLKEKMADVEIMIREKEEISPASAQGVFEDPFQDFLWEWSIKPAQEEGLYALALTVSSEFNPREFSLTTYVVDKKAEEDEEGEEE